MEAMLEGLGLVSHAVGHAVQDGKLTLKLFSMLLEAPVKHRHLEAVFVPVLPRLMTKLLQLTSKAQVNILVLPRAPLPSDVLVHACVHAAPCRQVAL